MHLHNSGREFTGFSIRSAHFMEMPWIFSLLFISLTNSLTPISTEAELRTLGHLGTLGMYYYYFKIISLQSHGTKKQVIS